MGLIIGANRGIGKALVEVLATHWGEAGLVYLTARSEAEAQAVQAETSAKIGLKLAYLVFDLADVGATHAACYQLMQVHGGVDIVVQNGAYLPRPGFQAIDDARPMIEANSHGTLRVLEAFLPILNKQGQMVIVVSAPGVLNNPPESLRPNFDTRI